MKKSSPNLPASSKMQMPSGGGMKMPKIPNTKNTTLLKGKKGGRKMK